MTEKKCEFKSAKELGLEQEEWVALITTLTLLEHGVIVHVPERHHDIRAKGPKRQVFNMGVWQSSTQCGSVMCIGGSAEYFGKLEMRQLNNKADDLAQAGNRALYELFYPGLQIAYDTLTAKQGAKALRHYLKTGRDDSWKVALRGK